MRRTIIAILLVLHGLGHSAAGIWAMSLGPSWAVVPLWLIAETGFVAAGLGLAGVPVLRTWWQPVAFFAGVSSVAMLASFGTLALVAGLLIDVLLLVLATAVAERLPELAPAPAPATAPATAPPNGRRRRAALAAAMVSWAVIAWLAVAITLRPWHTSWGTSAAQRTMSLPGDELVPDAHYRMDHAVTVHAPADSVRPLVARLGEESGGAYAFAGLENRRAVVVIPVDEHTSRLQVRLRGPGTPSLLGIALGPANLLVFEPAHFVRERRVLLGIRDRAEGRLLRVGYLPPSP
jgi:hypothetical protein